MPCLTPRTIHSPSCVICPGHEGPELTKLSSKDGSMCAATLKHASNFQ